MLKEIRPAIVLLVALTLITGLAYPLAMTGLAQVLFPASGQGSMIEKDGKVVGSALIGQVFADDKYFHGRPSATNDARPQGSDQDGRRALQRRQLDGLQPRSDQQGADRARQGRRRQAEGGERLRAGADRSGNHIGQRSRSAHLAGGGIVPGAARGQGAAISRRTACAQLVNQHVEGRSLGFIGEPRVNVLALNLALDRAAAR